MCVCFVCFLSVLCCVLVFVVVGVVLVNLLLVDVDAVRHVGKGQDLLG